MQTSTKMTKRTEVPLAPNRDLVYVDDEIKCDYTDGKWFPLLPEEVVIELPKETPDPYKARWDNFLFSEV